jgi:hypothetical protein
MKESLTFHLVYTSMDEQEKEHTQQGMHRLAQNQALLHCRWSNIPDHRSLVLINDGLYIGYSICTLHIHLEQRKSIFNEWK